MRSVVLILVFVTIVSFLVYRALCPQPCSGTWFWERILTPYSFIVDENKTQITFVWVGTDTREFFRVSRAAVTVSGPESIKNHIERLIGYMEGETQQWGRVVGKSYERDLQILTLVDMGANPVAWRAWWTQNRRLFVGSPSAYEELRKDRIARDVEQYGISERAKSELLWGKEYRRVRILCWSSLVTALTCFILALLISVKQFIKRRR